MKLEKKLSLGFYLIGLLVGLSILLLLFGCAARGRPAIDPRIYVEELR